MNFPFMKLKYISTIFSVCLISFSFYYTYNRHGDFAQSIDFSGGIKIELKLSEQINIEKLRAFYKEQNIEAQVQRIDDSSLPLAKIELSSALEQSLVTKAKENRQALADNGFSISAVDYLQFLMIKEFQNQNQPLEFASIDLVGPSIGAYLRESAINVLFVTLGLIIVYVAFRFQFKFAIGAMLALLHDLFMTTGLIGLLQIPLSTPVIAALLTILGYSINDTIVIFDRVRENLKVNRGTALESVVNTSINESLSRTIITSITTLLAVVSVYLVATESLKEMAYVLIIGIIIGTYSSSFIASPVLIFWDKLFNKSA
jgi:preprotein translocase subunit SecF